MSRSLPFPGSRAEYIGAKIVASNRPVRGLLNWNAMMCGYGSFIAAPLPYEGMRHADGLSQRTLTANGLNGLTELRIIHGRKLASLMSLVKSFAHRRHAAPRIALLT